MHAQSCTDDLSCQFLTCRAPASGVPAALWGNLQPVDAGQLPADRDNTDCNEFAGLGCNNANEPHWSSLDVENGWIFATTGFAWQIWDGRSPNESHPTRTVNVNAAQLPYFTGLGEEKLPLRDIDAPAGVDNVVAIAAVQQIGISIWNTTDKNMPRPLYQDHGSPNSKKGYQVYAATIGGTNYAFGATTGAGLLAYNMTVAQGFTLPCSENSPSALNPLCAGVYKGKVGSRLNVPYVDGVDNFVADSSGTNQAGVEIWNVSNPATPQLLLSALGNEFVHGVAMWKHGSSYYLALRVNTGAVTEGRIYDVSCIGTGFCSTIGSPLWTLAMNGGGSEYFTTYSKSGANDFLYFGSDDKCTGGLQREWLIDATVPSQAIDVTPPPALVGGQLTGYWGWYYRGNPTGFNRVNPRTGKFNGLYFNRAAYTLYDIHKLAGNQPPVANFSWSPTEVYPGTLVSFTDQSSGNPNAWMWTFQNGTPGTSTQHNPANVTFSGSGAKTVTLQAFNGVGNDTTQKTVQVLDPVPMVASVTASPNPALVCQPITFTATGVTGRPTLTKSWVVKDGGAMTVTTGGDVNPFVWQTMAETAPGMYTGTITVMNGDGTATKASPVVTLNALPSLAFTGPGGAPTNDVFAAGTVQFHVQTAGATEWSWDFGDGAGYTGYTNDPVNGPNPTHTYTSVATYQARVKIRNCVQAEITSNPLSVPVTQVTPLVASFQASCAFAPCSFVVNVPITFNDSSMGAEHWDYDWNGDGSYEDPDHTAPVTTHTYTSTGSYSPKLRVRRGASEQNVFTHSAFTVGTGGGGGGGGGGGASISVSCSPTSIQIGDSTSCSATASGCTASGSGWSWNTAGGSISGASNASPVSITWSSSGSKTVSATNSGCGSAVGFRSVSVNTGGTGGGGGDGSLHAAFVYTPVPQGNGLELSFDASSSTGAPTGYAWSFGDGTNGDGVVTLHTFAASGIYTVTLSISKPGSCFPICSSMVSHVVSVGGGGALSAGFDTDASCVSQFGFDQCTAGVGQAVGFTSTSQGASSLDWTFADGGMASGDVVSHTWTSSGTYLVTLTAGNGSTTSTASKTFTVGSGGGNTSANLLPWIAQTHGALEQTSDLYVFNPAASPMDLTVSFRKRGTPETNPPSADRTIDPGATLYVGDLLSELFGRDNQSGFLDLTATNMGVEPVIVSFNRTMQDGQLFGQSVPGFSRFHLTQQTSGGGMQHLVGLSDDNEKLTYFGVTNPNELGATYRLRFFDRLGASLGESDELALTPFGQKQFQVGEVRSAFGITDQDDYRVAVETLTGGPLYPYAGVLRTGSDDPIFVEPSSARTQKVYLVGAASSPGLNQTTWVSDAVLMNPTDQVLTTDMTFVNVGVNSEPQQTLSLTLQPGATERLTDVLFTEWGLTSASGELTFESTGAGDVFPVIQGETYENTNPARRFGLFMSALTDADAAQSGQRQVLTGLRQDATYVTTLWVFNPSEDNGGYTLIYRDLAGNELGRLSYGVPPGKNRQINPSFHPLPGGVVADGFTVEIQVLSGKLLSTAMVVARGTNDPAFIIGRTR